MSLYAPYTYICVVLLRATTLFCRRAYVAGNKGCTWFVRCTQSNLYDSTADSRGLPRACAATSCGIATQPQHVQEHMLYNCLLGRRYTSNPTKKIIFRNDDIQTHNYGNKYEKKYSLARK